MATFPPLLEGEGEPICTLPMPAPICYPVTGSLIESEPDEQLCRIAWPGAPVLVVVATRPTYRAPAGEMAYRLAGSRAQVWYPVGLLKLAP